MILCCGDWSFSAEQNLYCDIWCVQSAGCVFSSLCHFSIGMMRFTSVSCPRYITYKHISSSLVIKNDAVVVMLMMDFSSGISWCSTPNTKRTSKQYMQTPWMSWYSSGSPDSKCDARGALFAEDVAWAQLNSPLFVREVCAATADKLLDLSVEHFTLLSWILVFNPSVIPKVMFRWRLFHGRLSPVWRGSCLRI